MCSQLYQIWLIVFTYGHLNALQNYLGKLTIIATRIEHTMDRRFMTRVNILYIGILEEKQKTSSFRFQ